jgi:hypothetical protein
LRDWGIQEKESGARIEEAGETIGIVEDWNNGIMGLGAKNILRRINSIALDIKQGTEELSIYTQCSNIPSFQHSEVTPA